MAKVAEFSRLIAVEGIAPDKVRKETIEATPQECAALAKRFDLRELSGLKADIKIRRVEGGDVVRLEGHFSAEVVQTCVVSLQDVHGEVSGDFETYFADGKERYDDDEGDHLEGMDNAPETISNGNIDLGEVVAQYLSLEIDPYPRAPGVSLAAQLSETGTEVKNNPFQVLSGLKAGDKPAKASKNVKIVAAKAPKSPKTPTSAKSGGKKKGKAK